MKTSKFTESQFMAILKQVETWPPLVWTSGCLTTTITELIRAKCATAERQLKD